MPNHDPFKWEYKSPIGLGLWYTFVILFVYMVVYLVWPLFTDDKQFTKNKPFIITSATFGGVAFLGLLFGIMINTSHNNFITKHRLQTPRDQKIKGQPSWYKIFLQDYN